MSQRRSAGSVLLSDDSSRLLLRAHHLANSRRINSTADDDASTAAAPRKKKGLATAFRCPSCKRADSVECVVINLKSKVAEASCWACGASCSAAAHALTEPVDVYTEWADERRCARNGVDCDGDVVMCDA